MAEHTSNRHCRTCGSNTGHPEHDMYHRAALRERESRRNIDRAAEKLAASIAERFGTGDLLIYAEDAVSRAMDRLNLKEPPRLETVKRRSIGNGKRRQVWDRDDWTCQNCGTHAKLTIDHIVPVIAGGTDDLGNLQTLCNSCNASKGARV